MLFTEIWEYWKGRGVHVSVIKEDREGRNEVIFVLSTFYGSTVYLLKVKRFYGSVISKSTSV